MIEVDFFREPGHDDLPVPRYQTDGAAGVDLPAAVRQPVAIEPGRGALIPTGFRLGIPPGYEGQIRARSGLAMRHGLIVPNAPGTIDSDYRGEVGVLLMNLGPKTFVVRRGDRIAQLVVSRVERARFRLVERADDTERGDGGFGHTGV